MLMNRKLLNVLNLPIFSNLKETADVMRLDPLRLELLARLSDNKFYKSYYIPKRHGGSRLIEQPAKEMKAAQAWILRNILDKLHPSNFATAYIRKSPLTGNVDPHRYNRYYLFLDIEDFFQNIDFISVFRIFKMVGYNKKTSWFLARICTRKGHLPQGGVTSPALSNITNIRLDKRISGLCSRRNLTYTRYADDITISSNHPALLKSTIGTVLKIIRTEGFSHNQRKLKMLGPNNRCEVTGLTKNCSEPVFGIGVKKKRMMRAKMYNFVVKGITDDQYLNNESFIGWLNYLKGVDLASYNSMKKYWDSLPQKKN